MNNHARGMNHYIAQEKDREEWEKAIKERDRLINVIRCSGVKISVKELKQMNLTKLKNLLKEAKKSFNKKV